MLPAPVNASGSRPDQRPGPDRLLAGYRAALSARGAGNSSFLGGARAFLGRWPDPQAWAAQPLPARLAVNASTRPLLNYLMLFGYLQPGYDYLLERKLPAVLREAQASPVADDLNRFLAASTELGYTPKVTAGLASQITVRMLIQTRRPLLDLTDADIAEFDEAISTREQAGRPLKHYHTALYATRTVLYHLGAPVTTVATRDSAHLRWPWERHFTDVPDPIARSLVAYLECASGTRTRSTVLAMAGRLAHFAGQLAAIDPELASLGGLDRQRHIEPYLAAVAAARHPHTGAPLSASERRSRILTVGRMVDDINEWGWAQAPGRRLVFSRDVPRLPRPLPRYLPPDADRRLGAALRDSPQPLRAGALLLARATGVRIGELIDLELDCVHEVPGAGAWLKVPLGKLDTERMVPLDEDTLELVDQIVAHRSPGLPIRDARTGRLVEFLLTHQGRRVSKDVLRNELTHAAERAGLGQITPHQLRHTFATALEMSRIATDASFSILCECPLPAPQRVRPSAEVGVRSGTDHRDLRCHHSGCTKRHDEAPSTVVRGDDMMRPKQQGQALTRAKAATVRSAS